MEFQVVVRNVKVILGDSFVDVYIGIEDGKIAKISKNELKGKEVIDGEGGLAIPGAIDPHAHMWDPEYYYREDFDTGSKAAVLGGITTVIDMPLIHDVDTPQKVKERISVGEKNSRIDFSLHAGFIRDENMSCMDEILEEGVRSFKVFTCMPYKASDEAILKMMEFSHNTGAIFTFHAEDGAILERLYGKLSNSRRQIVVHEMRPPEAEELAIYKVGIYSLIEGGRVHIAHLSSSNGLKAVRDLKRRGADISVETAPHYLIFTRKDVERWGPYLKMAPSLKSEDDRRALWSGLADGSIDMVATDHAPCPKEEKEIGYEDPWKAWGGIPGLATMVPLLFTYGIAKGLLSPSRFLEIISQNAAKRFGLKERGRLDVGFSADLAVLDTKSEKKVRPDLYRHEWTPYEGMLLKGWPTLVLLRGKAVMERGEVVAKPGFGKFVKMSTT